MKSIFKPLIEEGLTTLKIRYDWKKDCFRFEVMKEWEADLDFSAYNKEFYADELLTDDIKYLNTAQVQALYDKYGLTGLVVARPRSSPTGQTLLHGMLQR